METRASYVCVPNRKGNLTGTELEDLVSEAVRHPEIMDIKVRKTNVTCTATPEAIDALRRKFAGRVIIEEDRPLSLV